MDNNEVKEKYVYTPGKALVCCKRCIFKKSDPGMFLCVICFSTALPTGLIFGIILGIENAIQRYIFLALALVFSIAGILSYLFTACSDPGTLPRRLDLPDYPESSKSLSSLNYISIEITINGKEYSLKICATCHIIRPLRSFHCSYCDSCIDEHDHHCAFMNNCIGKRNRRSFVYFLLFSTLFFLTDFTACAFRVIINPDTVSVIISALSVLTSFVLCCSTTGMLCSNLYFIGRGITTNEELRGKWGNANPFDEGCCRNCKSFFCQSNGPSIFDLESLCIENTRK